MTNTAASPAIKETLQRIFKQLPPKIIIGVGVLLMLGVCWSLLIQPLQQTLELRLQRYPTQLMSIQELNRTLLNYKDKSVRIPSLSESELSVLQQKLFSEGVKFTLTRVETTDLVRLELKIDEIEFSRWLELMVDFRKNNGLYASDVVIKKIDRAGVIQMSATLVQVR
ncbi:MAG: type II secretion system protein GspM [Burkholderiales bacterium]|nr:type II secretion system protein GspM [Burkholderiales bacterium]